LEAKKFLENPSFVAKLANMLGKKAIDEARTTNAYVFAPEIIHWETRATEWSGIPSKSEIKIVVFDGATGKIVKSTILRGSSAPVTIAGNRPDDLMSEIVARWIRNIYQGAPINTMNVRLRNNHRKTGD
jgi:hypothetical protein